MNALEMEEWRKVRRKKKWKVARPYYKLIVGSRMMNMRKTKGGKVESIFVDLSLKSSGRSKEYTNHPP